MRDYGQIQCSLWTHPRFKSMSDFSQLLLLYLLSGRHSNGLGCYSLPLGYVSADLKKGIDTVSKGFAELSEKGWAYHCESTEFVFIPKFLKWNSIANPKVAIARQKEFDEVPSSFTYRPQLAGALLQYGSHFKDGFETVLQTVYGTLSKQEPNLTEPNRTEPIMSSKPESPEDKPNRIEADARKAIEYLNEKTNKKPGQGFKLVDSNLKLARARLKEGHTLETMKSVVDRKVDQWLGDPKWGEYLRPATLFNAEKFNNYVGQLGDKSQTDELDDIFGGESSVTESEYLDGEFQEVPGGV